MTMVEAFMNANKFMAKKKVPRKMKSIFNSRIQKKDVVCMAYVVDKIQGTEAVFETKVVKASEVEKVDEKYVLDADISKQLMTMIIVNKKIADTYFKMKQNGTRSRKMPGVR